MTIKERYIIILILALAIILRFKNLSSIPVGFNDDEAAFGYNAYSILNTGRDEWGKLLPFPTFESFGDWKLVFYLYSTVAPVALFGLNEFSTRLPSVMFGIASIFTTYLLARKFTNQKIGLMSAFLLAISPWHVVASRNAFESDVLIFFLTLGTFLFLTGLTEKKRFILSTIAFSAAFYVYRAAWTFVPILVVTITHLYRKEIKKEYLKYLLLIPLITLPLIPTILTFSGQSRFFQESFLTGVGRSGIIDEVNENRGVCLHHLGSIGCKIAYNKYAVFSHTFISNYFKSVSYPTYFEKANHTGFQSFSTRGVLYFFELPLMLLGLYYLIKNKISSRKIILLWLLLVPLAPSIIGYGNYGRMNILMPIPQILSSTGIYFSMKLIKKLRTGVVLGLTIVLLASVFKFQVDLFSIEPFHNSRSQRYGYKELFKILKSYEGQYNNIYLSRGIDDSHQYIQYLFFNQVNPDFYHANSQNTKSPSGWIIQSGIGNYKFIPAEADYSTLRPESLVVLGEKQIEVKLDPVFTVKDLRGDTVFKAYDVDRLKSAISQKNEI